MFLYITVDEKEKENTVLIGFSFTIGMDVMYGGKEHGEAYGHGGFHNWTSCQ